MLNIVRKRISVYIISKPSCKLCKKASVLYTEYSAQASAANISADIAVIDLASLLYSDYGIIVLICTDYQAAAPPFLIVFY